ncbi:MAG: acetyl-CoA carboxylase biotin carboxylase subunit [Pseudomonadota bacterium]|nr:acetyl-CoA carboxylase biotin carboxylase subunit [Pseudomonadota bacterium]
MTSVLIANRGEIALRVLRACKVLGLHTIAVYSKADKDLLHLRLADETICIGSADAQSSYLSIPAIISAAEISGADYIHPGYGFLSENHAFAKQLEHSGFKLIGPSADVIKLMGDKIHAKKAMREAGLPCVPGSKDAILTLNQAKSIIEEIGFPILIKASAGGGGRGMRVVKAESELETALEEVQKEAGLLFKDERVFIERYLDQPRHIEFQVLADQHGHAICLGDRDCSIQRRHQKIIEEAPAFGISTKQRDEIMHLCVDACKKIGYVGVGTFEFLYDGKEFYFIEMNTRIQVEHPVTELITGIDLIEQQIKVALGDKLKIKQEDVKFNGHAIECRINAENPKTMLPSPGLITDYHAASGPGIRVDSHIYSGYRVPHQYDSLIAKVIAHGDDRHHVIHRLKNALMEMIIEGVSTNTSLHCDILDDPRFQSENISIHFLNEFIGC